MNKLISYLLVGICLICFSAFSSLAEEVPPEDTTPTPIFQENILVQETSIENARALTTQFQEHGQDELSQQVDFAKLIEFVKEKKGTALIGSINKEIKGSHKAEEIIEQVTETILRALSQEVNEDNMALYAPLVAKSFTDLLEQNDKPWFNMTTIGTYYNPSTQYTYNTLFVVEKNHILLMVPVKFTVVANISEDETLTISPEDKHDYKVHIEALKIISLNQ